MIEEWTRAGDGDSTYIPSQPEWTETRENSPARALLFKTNFERGARNAQEHMTRMLSTRDLAGCPCLGCTGRFR